MGKSDIVERPNIPAYVPGAEDWNALKSSSDEVLGHEKLGSDALDKLMGVPFIITRVIFRDGVQRPHTPYRDDYVSCEAIIAPKEVIAERARKGRLNLDDISVEPGEHVVFNDGSTGIYRQVVQYLEAKDFIKLPKGADVGHKGECRFDLPRTQWDDGDEEGSTGINIRLFCPRGLRYSEYPNDYNPDGSKTRYIA